MDRGRKNPGRGRGNSNRSGNSTRDDDGMWGKYGSGDRSRSPHSHHFATAATKGTPKGTKHHNPKQRFHHNNSPHRGNNHHHPHNNGQQQQQQGSNNNKRRHNSPKKSGRSRSHDNNFWRDNVGLYNETGVGRTARQRQVQRFSISTLLPLRLQYIAPPSDEIWKPEPKVVWVDPTRQEQIESLQESYMKKFIPLRDLPPKQQQRSRLVSSKLGDMQEDDEAANNNNNQLDDKSVVSVASVGTLGSQFDIDDNPLRKTMLLLNKLSWTTLDKLTPQLIQIMDSVDFDSNNNTNAVAAILDVKTIFGFILEKAQMEVHFGPMYAQVCKRILDHNKSWRKLLLQLCQSEFQIEIAQRIQQLDKDGDTDFSLHSNESEERDYQILLIRKKYFGHIQFIGELFKLKIIKLDIMLWCLGRLLFKEAAAADTNNGDDNGGANTTVVSEDQLECFVKLMTVVGAAAEEEINQSGGKNERWDQCWDQVQKYIAKKKPSQDGPPEAFISSRIRFLLKDLWDLKENGWTERRAKETAKTIAEIHQDFQKEEQQARSRAKSEDFPTHRRHTADPGPRRLPKRSGSEGYISIPSRQQNNRWSSDSNTDNLRRSKSNVDAPIYPSATYHKKGRSFAAPAQIPRTKVARSKSHDGGASSTATSFVNQSQIKHQGKGGGRSSNKKSNKQTDSISPPVEIITKYPSPLECQDKCKNILKEFFVSGDLDDAVLSWDEMIGASRSSTTTTREESCERGANVIEAGVLLVMEMKQVEVDKFLNIVRKCLETNKIEMDSLSQGLSVPLEFLLDIEIDAPMAGSLLAHIVADWVVVSKEAGLKLDKLLLEESPELFRTDGNPAVFCCKVFKAMKKTMETITDADLSIVTKLMTDRDRETYSSSRDLLQTFLT